MSPDAELTATIRNPKATSRMLRDALHRYMEARKRPHKPLGDGDMLVVNTKGQLRMMTREEYTEMVHTRKKPKKRRGKDKAEGIEYSYQSIGAGQVSKLELGQELLQIDKDSFDVWVDTVAKRHQLELEGDAYYGEF